MTESPAFQLEHFYFGNLVDQHNRKSAAPGVIARTPGCTQEHVTECLRLAKVMPPQRIADSMPAVLALFRGGTATDFILVKAQRTAASLPQILYIMLPATLARQSAGNILAFDALAMKPMPVFYRLRSDLEPLDLPDLKPLSTDEQVESLMAALLYSRDSFSNLEGILAGLVQGWPVAIVNSPLSLAMRLQFVQGLLNLLPIPARIGITFTTDVSNPDTSTTQIKFLNDRVTPDRHLVYDWDSGEMLTRPPADSYSRYMIGQFRLDPSLVIEQTTKLSHTTAWRAQHRENLGSALSFVSHRAALDQVIREGQPADRDLVADILRQDPTLSDELRQVYARHLLAFAIALNEAASADVVPTVAVTNLEIAQATTEQLKTGIRDGHAGIVYHLLERWLLHVPETSDLGWHPLLHTAARQYFTDLLQQKAWKPALDFLRHIHTATPTLRLKEIMPQIISAAQPFTRSQPNLARIIFLLAVEALPAGELQRLLGDREFTRHLPQATQTALAYLEPQPRHPAPPQVLETGARDFSGGHRMWVLARLVEWAMYLQRTELVDTAALQALLVMAQSPENQQFKPLILHVTDDFTDLAALQTLTPPGPRILIQLLLLIHEFDQAVIMLEFYQGTLFGMKRLSEFTQLAQDIFLKTPLSPDALNSALDHLEGSGIWPEPRAMMYCGALMNRQWSPDQAKIAHKLTMMVFTDSALIQRISSDIAIQLLSLHARTNNTDDALHVGAALVEHALRTGGANATILTQMWPVLTQNTEMRGPALELLRRFIRKVPLDQAPTLIAYFGTELGNDIALALHATYIMRLVLGGGDLVAFADEVHTALELFRDIATTYHSDRDLPPMHRLRRDLDTMTGGLTSSQREQVAENILKITQLVYQTGQETLRKREQQALDDQLLHERAAPRRGVDLLRLTGGHFAGHKAVPLELGTEAMSHIFGNRSAAMFFRETDVIARLLNGLHTIFSIDSPLQITPEGLSGELDSLWNSLRLHDQRQIQDHLAQGCQQLAEVIVLIANDASDRVLADSGLGRQLENGQKQPRKALEALRWIYGYFARKHTRSTRT
ncbi:MAG: hypothetical protein JXQ72_11665 [Anaerolineae bacterium]|nr:hypothetical protein [Anaerolineae bacterium]